MRFVLAGALVLAPASAAWRQFRIQTNIAPAVDTANRRFILAFLARWRIARNARPLPWAGLQTHATGGAKFTRRRIGFVGMGEARGHAFGGAKVLRQDAEEQIARAARNRLTAAAKTKAAPGKTMRRLSDRKEKFAAGAANVRKGGAKILKSELDN